MSSQNVIQFPDKNAPAAEPPRGSCAVAEAPVAVRATTEEGELGDRGCKGPPEDPPWMALPIRAFATTSGVLIGYYEADELCEKRGEQMRLFPNLRLHAPALASLEVSGVRTTPLNLVDGHLDVNAGMLIGETMVGDVLREAYVAYARRFALDGFRVRALSYPAFMEAQPESPSPAMTRAFVLAMMVELRGGASAPVQHVICQGKTDALSLEEHGVQVFGDNLLCDWVTIVNTKGFRYILEAMRILPQNRVAYMVTAAGAHAHAPARLEDLTDLDRQRVQRAAPESKLIACSVFKVTELLRVAEQLGNR